MVTLVISRMLLAWLHAGKYHGRVHIEKLVGLCERCVA